MFMVAREARVGHPPKVRVNGLFYRIMGFLTSYIHHRLSSDAQILKPNI